MSGVRYINSIIERSWFSRGRSVAGVMRNLVQVSNCYCDRASGGLK